MKILSWNLAQFWFYPEPNTAKERNFEYIAAVVKEEGPDIVVFQEVRDLAQTKVLAKLMGFKRWHFAENKGDCKGNAIFTNSKGKLGEMKIGGRAPVTFDNKEISLVGVHLDYVSAKVRRSQLVKLCSLKRPKTVIIGDCNLWRGKPYDKQTYQMVREHFNDKGTRGTCLFGTIRIDYCFTNLPHEIRVLRRRKGLMDHYPIVVEIKKKN